MYNIWLLHMVRLISYDAERAPFDFALESTKTIVNVFPLIRHKICMVPIEQYSTVYRLCKIEKINRYIDAIEQIYRLWG